MWRKTDGLAQTSTYVFSSRSWSREGEPHDSPLEASVVVALLINFKQNRYINNAFGDESLSTVHGERLNSIKANVDPQGRF